MGGASVESIDALRDFRARFCKLAEQAQAALLEAEGELTRTGDWLTHSQTLHWKNQLRIRGEELTRARSALNRKKNERSPTGARQSCVEEEKAFKKAQARLEEAQRKDAATKRWVRQLEQTAFTYRPVAQALLTTVEADVPRALVRVDQMIDALAAYLEGGKRPDWVKSDADSGGMTRAALPDLDHTGERESVEPADTASPPREPA